MEGVLLLGYLKDLKVLQPVEPVEEDRLPGPDIPLNCHQTKSSMS